MGFDTFEFDRTEPSDGGREARELVEGFTDRKEVAQKAVDETGEALRAKREEYLQWKEQVYRLQGKIHRIEVEIKAEKGEHGDFNAFKGGAPLQDFNFQAEYLVIAHLRDEISVLNEENADLFYGLVDYEIAYVEALREYYDACSAAERNAALIRVENQLEVLGERGVKIGKAIRSDNLRLGTNLYDGYVKGTFIGARLNMFIAQGRVDMQRLDLMCHSYVLEGENPDAHPSVMRGGVLYNGGWSNRSGHRARRKKSARQKFYRWLVEEKGLEPPSQMVD
jgi:hypothetical protein